MYHAIKMAVGLRSETICDSERGARIPYRAIVTVAPDGHRRWGAGSAGIDVVINQTLFKAAFDRLTDHFRGEKRKLERGYMIPSGCQEASSDS